MLVATAMEMVISIKMGIHCYRLIVAKKQDQLQFIRTPEGKRVLITSLQEQGLNNEFNKQ